MNTKYNTELNPKRLYSLFQNLLDDYIMMYGAESAIIWAYDNGLTPEEIYDHIYDFELDEINKIIANYLRVEEED